MIRRRLAVCTCVLALALLVPKPAYALLGLGSATPNQGTTAGGTVVEIVALDSLLGTITGLEFGGVPATNVQLVDLFTIRATAPAHAAGLVDIKLRITINILGIPIDQILTLTNGYTYVVPHTLTSISPVSGPTAGGTVVTVLGASFRSGMRVRFGPNFGTNVIVNSTSVLTVRTPPGPSGPVDVVLLNPDNETATLVGGFTYVGPVPVNPTITSVTPNNGPQSGGTPIVITGTGFQPGALVTFCGQAVPVSALTATTINITTVPCPPGPVTITVTNPDGGTATATSIFTSNATSVPTVTAIAPSSGSPGGGTPVVVSGTQFQPGATVVIGCGPATGVNVVNANSIQAVTPACPAGSTGDVRVTNPDGGTATLPGGFTFGTSAPTLSSITPATGPATGGTPVTISGTNFANGATVTIGGVAATAVVLSTTTTLTAVTPAHAAGVVNVVINNPDGGTATLAGGFTYTGGGGGTPGDTDGDGLPDACEIKFGLNPNSGVSPDGANDDPDGDGRTNLQECTDGTHPRGFHKRYLAEGATGTFWDTSFALLNHSTAPAITLLEYRTLTGDTPSDYLIVPADSRRTVNPENNAALSAASFATVVESDVPLTIERSMKWNASHYGSHSETAQASLSTTWYIAEGATPPPLSMFYLILNPQDAPAHVRVTYYQPPPTAPIVKDYTFPLRSRGNIWVDAEGPEFEAGLFSAKFESDQPIMVERVMYGDAPGQIWAAGTAATALADLSPTWFFAEGAASTFFDTFFLVQNPNAAGVTVRATYLLDDGTVFQKDYPVAGNSRYSIGANTTDPRLPGHAFSTKLETLGGEGVLAERAMWWPVGGPWIEGHASAGVTSTGVEFIVAGGEQGGTDDAHTYVLVANHSNVAGNLRLRAIADDDTVIERFFTINASSRFNVDVPALFPEMNNKKFGLVIESIGTSPVQITAEVSVYLSADGVFWSAGSNAQATRVR